MSKHYLTTLHDSYDNSLTVMGVFDTLEEARELRSLESEHGLTRHLSFEIQEWAGTALTFVWRGSE